MPHCSYTPGISKLENAAASLVLTVLQGSIGIAATTAPKCQHFSTTVPLGTTGDRIGLPDTCTRQQTGGVHLHPPITSSHPSLIAWIREKMAEKRLEEDMWCIALAHHSPFLHTPFSALPPFPLFDPRSGRSQGRHGNMGGRI